MTPGTIDGDRKEAARTWMKRLRKIPLDLSRTTGERVTKAKAMRGQTRCSGHSPYCKPVASSRCASQRMQAMPRKIVLGWPGPAWTGVVS